MGGGEDHRQILLECGSETSQRTDGSESCDTGRGQQAVQTRMEFWGALALRCWREKIKLAKDTRDLPVRWEENQKSL